MPAERASSGIGGLPAQTTLTPMQQPAATASSATALTASTSPVTPALGPGGIPLSPAISAALSQQRPFVKKDRSTYEKLVFETGASYGFGFLSGGAVGFVQGMQRHIPNNNVRLRLNAVLNSSGKLSAATANSFAVFAMVYSMTKSFVQYRWSYDNESMTPDAIGVATATTLSAYTRHSPFYSLVFGGVMGGTMYAFLYARKKFVDDRGTKIVDL